MQRNLQRVLPFTIPVMLCLVSCEGYVKLSGNVVSATGRAPIEGAKVELLKIPTDSLTVSRDSGRFMIGSRIIGMVRKPKFTVRVSKEGYQTLEVPVTRESKYIYQFDDRYIFPLLKTGEDPNTVILPFSFLPPVMAATATPTTIDEQEMKLTEKLLQDCVADHYKLNTTKTNVAQWLSRYKRQWIAYRNQAGEKMVWINCFCDYRLFPNWRTRLASADAVSDGGDCFIRVTINLDRKTYAPMVTNGQG